jgi:uncharacterized Fe-S radical SAM superfamily protein PflX
MQEFKKPGQFGFVQQEAIKVKGPDIKLPDMHEAAKLAGLKDIELEEQARKKEEQEDQEREAAGQKLTEEQEQELKEKRAERRRRLRPCCFCGDRGCRIGAFTLSYEEDEDVQG